MTAIKETDSVQHKLLIFKKNNNYGEKNYLDNYFDIYFMVYA